MSSNAGWRVRAVVKLKDQVLDVQGRAVESAMKQLGYADVKDVRIGKIIEYESAKEPSQEMLSQIGRNLFANPVIETVEFTVRKNGSSK